MQEGDEAEGKSRHSVATVAQLQRWDGQEAKLAEAHLLLTRCAITLIQSKMSEPKLT